ncbi:hypothetical protein Tco_1077027 [Tanacetum coccineum]
MYSCVRTMTRRYVLMDVQNRLLNGHLAEEDEILPSFGMDLYVCCATVLVAVAFAQNMYSDVTDTGEEHWIAVKTNIFLFRYTKDMFLVYGGNLKKHRVSCYMMWDILTDADNSKVADGYRVRFYMEVLMTGKYKTSIFANSS